jgi:hypothetical protein
MRARARRLGARARPFATLARRFVQILDCDDGTYIARCAGAAMILVIRTRYCDRL